MQHLTDYYILYLLLICRIFLKYGTGNVMNNNYEKDEGGGFGSEFWINGCYEIRRYKIW